MVISYKWSVMHMDVYPTYEGFENVVYAVRWNLEGVDKTQSATVSGLHRVEFDSTAVFTPYNNLTQEQVIGWVKNIIGVESVAELEARIAAQIAARSNPDLYSPDLPWN